MPGDDGSRFTLRPPFPSTAFIYAAGRDCAALFEFSNPGGTPSGQALKLAPVDSTLDFAFHGFDLSRLRALSRNREFPPGIQAARLAG